MRVVPLVGDVRRVTHVALERGRTAAAAAAAAVGGLAVVAAHALQDAAVDRLRLLCRRASRRVVLLVRAGGGATSGQGLQDDRVTASGSGASMTAVWNVEKCTEPNLVRTSLRSRVDS